MNIQAAEGKIAQEPSPGGEFENMQKERAAAKKKFEREKKPLQRQKWERTLSHREAWGCHLVVIGKKQGNKTSEVKKATHFIGTGREGKERLKRTVAESTNSRQDIRLNREKRSFINRRSKITRPVAGIGMPILALSYQPHAGS